LEIHSAFPEGANIEFMERVAKNALRVFVWERGCGLTQACGTGACAAVAVAAGQGLVDYDEEITVTLPGGALSIRVEAESARVWMTGPAVLVAEGEIHL
jgi:diaminopimelate epimerase